MTLERIVRDNVHGPKVRRMLEMAFQQTRMAMCFTDPHRDDNPIVAINAAFTRLTGYEEAEIIGRNCRFLQSPETDPAEVQRIRDCIRRREVAYFELQNVRKDGTPFWNALHVGPVFSDEGELLYFFGSQWDVTEKVEAVRAMKGEARVGDVRLQGAIDEVRRLREAIDQANDAMLLTEYAPLAEPGPRIVWVSAGFERMSGYRSEEVIGRTPRMFQGPLTDRRELDRIAAAVRDGTPVPDASTVNYRKDGTPYHVEWSIAPVAGSDGAPAYWLSVQRDVTERVRAQEERDLLAQELNHRHKNLLTVISALANLIPTEGMSAAQYRDALKARIGSLRRAHDLVFADGAADAQIGVLVDSLLAPYPSERVTRRGAPVRLAPRTALNLSLVLHELATNAAKYGALSVPDGRVDLEWRAAEGDLHIDWTETGGPAPIGAGHRGFGSRLLGMLAGGGGRADAGLTLAPGGARFAGALALD